MKNRTQIDAADLYVLLQREFRRRQPACDACFVQLPFRVDRHDEASPNWELLMPPQCDKGCAVLLEELVLDFGARYDLRTDAGPAD